MVGQRFLVAQIVGSNPTVPASTIQIIVDLLFHALGGRFMPQTVPQSEPLAGMLALVITSPH